MDISCTEIEICGYVDIEMNTVGGEEDFKQTRILIVAGTATTVILGRTDMKILKILGENFPLPMQQTSFSVERQARARTKPGISENLGQSSIRIKQNYILDYTRL